MWHVLKNRLLEGPFTVQQIYEYVLLGEFKLGDYVLSQQNMEKAQLNYVPLRSLLSFEQIQVLEKKYSSSLSESPVVPPTFSSDPLKEALAAVEMNSKKESLVSASTRPLLSSEGAWIPGMNWKFWLSSTLLVILCLGLWPKKHELRSSRVPAGAPSDTRMSRAPVKTQSSIPPPGQQAVKENPAGIPAAPLSSPEPSPPAPTMAETPPGEPVETPLPDENHTQNFEDPMSSLQEPMYPPPAPAEPASTLDSNNNGGSN